MKITGKLWIVYDERAAWGDSDAALVLETCNSRAEAMREPRNRRRRACHDGIVFEYDTTDENTLINERMIGPNFSEAHQ